MKRVFLILVVLFISFEVFSQFSMGGQVSYMNLFGGTGIKTFGVGIKGEYPMDDKTVFTGSASYYFGNTLESTTYGYSYSSTTDPSTIDVDLFYKIKFANLTIGAKRYFVGDYESDFGFYGFIDLGLMLAPATTEVGTYDSDLYYTTVTDGEFELLSSWIIGPGLGLEKDFDFGYIFADLKFNLPATSANGVAVDIDIPASFMVNAGVRIPF